MATWSRFATAGALCATFALAPGLLVATSQPADAGLFTWLGGRGNQGERRLGAATKSRRTVRRPRRRRVFQPAPQAPRSGALHGDELPPEEGTAATRQWITNPALGTPTLSTRNIEATKAAIAHYQSIVANGGWPTVPAYAMRPGSTGQAVEILHRRLEISGDLVGQSIPTEYDEAVTQAVRKFQSRHALPPTGTIDRATIDVMNVPATVRLTQLQANLEAAANLGAGGDGPLRRGQYSCRAG